MTTKLENQTTAYLHWLKERGLIYPQITTEESSSHPRTNPPFERKIEHSIQCQRDDKILVGSGFHTPWIMFVVTCRSQQKKILEEKERNLFLQILKGMKIPTKKVYLAAFVLDENGSPFCSQDKYIEKMVKLVNDIRPFFVFSLGNKCKEIFQQDPYFAKDARVYSHADGKKIPLIFGAALGRLIKDPLEKKQTWLQLNSILQTLPKEKIY